MKAQQSSFPFGRIMPNVFLGCAIVALALAGPAAAVEQLVGCTNAGSLFTVDVNTGLGTPIGVLPIPATEIEYDLGSGRAFAQARDGTFFGQEFDLCTAVAIGPAIGNGGSYTGLEWVNGTLYGTRILGGGGPSDLRILDPWTGASVPVGPTGVGPISGLAYDRFSRTMYGISGGAGAASLLTISLTTGVAAVVGPAGFQAGSLSFGPDNQLYGGGTGPNAGELWRIDPATGVGTLVGPTGFAGVTGLALAWTCPTGLPPACDLAWEMRAPFLDPRTGSGIEGASASLIGRSIYVSHGYRFGDSNLFSIYDIPTNTWTHGGLLAPDAVVARSEMGGGTALGRHYAVGGRTGPTNAVEEFDPCTGLWTPMPPMPTIRGGLGVASNNNLIYAIGGRDGGSFGIGPMHNETEVFDPSALTWATLAPMPVAVGDNYSTVAWHGRIYVFGGVNNAGTVVNNTQVYDIATNTWTQRMPMPTARGDAMAGVIDGKIAVFGGFDGLTNLTVTELYDPVANSWTVGPTMLVASSEIAQGLTYDEPNGIFAIGSGIFGVSGSIVELLTHQTPPPLPLVWETLAPFIDPTSGGSGIEGSAGSLIDGRIYVSHGYRGLDSPFLSMYDIRTNTWTHGMIAAGVPRSEMAGARAQGHHYAIGGRTGPNADNEMYDPLAGAWFPRAPMLTARGGLGAASIGNLIYAIGGRDGATFGGGLIFGANEVYDACTDAWAPLAPLLIPVSDNYATVAWNDRIYVFGGATSPIAVTGATQIYDIATGTWSFGAPMPTPRAAAAAGIVAGRIAVFGGYDPVAGSNLAVTEVYDPISNSWSAGPAMPAPVSEMAQGPTWDEEGCYSIGSGIFGVSGSPVYRLRCLNDKVVAVEPRPVIDARLALSKPWPNPSRGAVTFAYSLPAPGTTKFDIYDIAGRRVWGTEENAANAGSHSLVWDGMTSEGARAPAGMYFVHMANAAGSRTAPVVRIQ